MKLSPIRQSKGQGQQDESIMDDSIGSDSITCERSFGLEGIAIL